MANNKNNKHTAKNTGRSSILNMMAFVSVMLLAFAYLISFILGWIDATKELAGIITRIATAFALIVAIILSYPTAARQKKELFALWVVAAIIVFVAYVLGISFKLF